MEDQKNILKIPQVEARSCRQLKQTSWISTLTCEAKKEICTILSSESPSWACVTELKEECSFYTGSVHALQLQEIRRWQKAIWKEGSPPPPTQISIQDIEMLISSPRCRIWYLRIEGPAFWQGIAPGFRTQKQEAALIFPLHVCYLSFCLQAQALTWIWAPGGVVK